MKTSLWITISFCCFCLLFYTPFAKATDIEVAFSSGKNQTRPTALERILQKINHAQSEILVAAYSFTSKPVALALRNAHTRGVKVAVVADKKSNNSKYTAVTFLDNARIPVCLNGDYAIMHNKFMIIDKKDVQTGSFNYSASAVNRNAENIIIINNNKEIANLYIKEWKNLWICQ